jgi:mRNA interferase YafQ
MLSPIKIKKFEKDLEKSRKQSRNFTELNTVLRDLIEEKPLPPKYCDHPLKGNWKGYRDCHVENDWVLIYKIDKKEKTLILVRLGSHSELFR